jgi:hypothetical protein
MWHSVLWLSAVIEVGLVQSAERSKELDISKSIEASTQFEVSMADQLGEGEGCFDSDSRYDLQTVNCQTWLQWVLADAYARGNEQSHRRNMDALRYYEEVSFAHRKHFIDRWILYAPEPLMNLEHPDCQSDQSQIVTLQLSTFRNHHQFPMPLFAESSLGTEQHVVSYLSLPQSNLCMDSLEEGWYVGFFVANDQWLSKWSSIGQMGLVHSMIVEKTGGQVFFHHASMDSKRVVKEPWKDFQTRLSVVAKGYRFFALDPTWFPKDELPNGEFGCQ